ncbi:MAG: translation initiation factor eIF4B [Amphiamblys sp. WSBS2006]|nr:MAG: translation initiation factor eIF4B [Amphiamblys sp. WSBS2006]
MEKEKFKTLSLKDLQKETKATESWAEDVSLEDVRLMPLARMTAAQKELDLKDVPSEPPFTAHVSNLSFDTTEEEVSKHFASTHPHLTALMRNRDGTSRGRANIDFKARDSLIQALSLTGTMVRDRQISVSVSAKKHDRFGKERFSSSDTLHSFNFRTHSTESLTKDVNTDGQKLSLAFRDRPNDREEQRQTQPADFRFRDRKGSQEESKGGKEEQTQPADFRFRDRKDAEEESKGGRQEQSQPVDFRFRDRKGSQEEAKGGREEQTQPADFRFRDRKGSQEESKGVREEQKQTQPADFRFRNRKDTEEEAKGGKAEKKQTQPGDFRFRNRKDSREEPKDDRKDSGRTGKPSANSPKIDTSKFSFRARKTE